MCRQGFGRLDVFGAVLPFVSRRQLPFLYLSLDVGYTGLSFKPIFVFRTADFEFRNRSNPRVSTLTNGDLGESNIYVFLCIDLELLGRHAVQVDERTDHTRSKYDVRRILDQLPTLFERVLHVVILHGLGFTLDDPI